MVYWFGFYKNLNSNFTVLITTLYYFITNFKELLSKKYDKIGLFATNIINKTLSPQIAAKYFNAFK